MSRRGGAASIVASPVLVGAVTVLVSIVAVILAYNANSGLPFVPTYQVNVTVPNASLLVPGNEVRVGGFRVGIVETLTPKTVRDDQGDPQAAALLELKLDKSLEELPVDTTVLVRPRSSLGLKYLALEPGQSSRTYKPGATIPFSNAKLRPEEFDDLLATFPAQVRRDAQTATVGFGNALVGRGASLNETIHALGPVVLHLGPVMSNLSNPQTELDMFFKEIGETTAQIAPVAGINAQQFTEMADTFEAIGRYPDRLRQFISKGPPTIDTSVESFEVQEPFLADNIELAQRLRPAAQALPEALPDINSALEVGQPVLRRSPELAIRTQEVLRALRETTENPDTLRALRDFTDTVRVTAPLVEYVAPYQTVCNNWTYFFGNTADHFSEEIPDARLQRILQKGTNPTQDDGFQDRAADRPADTDDDGDDPQDLAGPNRSGAVPFEPFDVLHGQLYSPAVDQSGNADCQAGQFGYLDGPLVSTGRYGEDEDGGRHVVVDSDTPGLRGPTFTGVDNIDDVDDEQEDRHPDGEVEFDDDDDGGLK